VSKVIHTVIGILIGAAIGFAWNWFFSCPTGRCPFSHNPQLATLISILWGGAMGFIVTKI
jgi:uncharacterized membrane protein